MSVGPSASPLVGQPGPLKFRKPETGRPNMTAGHSHTIPSHSTRHAHMSLRIIVGPMFAGKTSEIQSVVRRFECLGKKVLVVTANIDVRYTESVDCAITHDLVHIPAIAMPVDGLEVLLLDPRFIEATAIVVDEAQFFVNCLVPFVQSAVETFGKHVIVVGLDGDANRLPFGDILALIPLADSVEKKTALCRRCCDGTVALFSRARARDTASTKQIAVGGADMYEPTCRRHFLCLNLEDEVLVGAGVPTNTSAS